MEQLELIKRVNAHLIEVKKSIQDSSHDEIITRIACAQQELNFLKEHATKRNILQVDSERDSNGRLITPSGIRRSIANDEKRKGAGRKEKRKLSKVDAAIERFESMGMTKEQAIEAVKAMGVKI